jgi:hypothetical protein
MKFYFVLTAFLLIITYNAEAIIINEIMPDPDDNCKDCSEWIEITSHENSSLENITLDTGEDLIALNGSIQANEFVIITKNSSMFSEIWVDQVNIFENSRMSLRNAGDNITLYNNSEILQRIEYTSSEVNISYGLCDSFFVPQNISTPGLPNTCDQGETNETNTTNNTCDLYLWVRCDDIFVMSSNKYRLMVEDLEGGDHKPEIEYWIEDMFGNTVRNKRRTNNTNADKSWTPAEIAGTEAYIIYAMITHQACNDTNISNNLAERMIVVKGEEQTSNSDCSCETKIIEKEKSCSCGPCPKCDEKTKKEEVEFGINFYPKEVRKDEEIEIKIKIKNPSNYERKYTVYSYIYEEKKPLSLGFDGYKWLNTWDANKQNVSLDENSTLTLTLKNRIANDTEPGEYKIRVRIWLEGKKHDITEKILIKEIPRHMGEDENRTEVEETEILDDKAELEARIPTGRAISERNDNWFSQLMNNVINFFKNLFNV